MKCEVVGSRLGPPEVLGSWRSQPGAGKTVGWRLWVRTRRLVRNLEAKGVQQAQSGPALQWLRDSETRCTDGTELCGMRGH